MEENVDSNGIISTKEIEDFYNVNMILRLNILLALIDLFLFMTELNCLLV